MCNSALPSSTKPFYFHGFLLVPCTSRLRMMCPLTDSFNTTSPSVVLFLNRLVPVTTSLHILFFLADLFFISSIFGVFSSCLTLVVTPSRKFEWNFQDCARLSAKSLHFFIRNVTLRGRAELLKNRTTGSEYNHNLLRLLLQINLGG